MNETEEVGEVIADDDDVKATLVNVEYVNDEMFDEEKYVINIELENKTDKKYMYKHMILQLMVRWLMI